ncbi:hypothetical protein HS7_12320 [Sulfolobales archaeon HS-7]|nr:hypothetical protein HS7_12320 [Sulfolobales archaeon HS-7]
MPLITVKVGEELKRKMEKYPEINWSEVIRRSIEEELRHLSGKDIAKAVLLTEKNKFKPDVDLVTAKEARKWRSLLTPR